MNRKILFLFAFLTCPLYGWQYDSTRRFNQDDKLIVHFNENKGTSITDNSIYQKTGLLVGSPAWVTGKFGWGLFFAEGTQQFSSHPVLTIPTGNYDFTINMWVKDNPHGAGVYIYWLIGERNTGQDWDYILLRNNNVFSTSSEQTGGATFTVLGVGGNDIPLDRYSMITFTRRASDNREQIWKDGKFLETKTGLTLDLHKGEVWIGGRNTTHSCNCTMDDFVFSPYIWSDAKIRSVHAQGMGNYQKGIGE